MLNLSNISMMKHSNQLFNKLICYIDNKKGAYVAPFFISNGLFVKKTANILGRLNKLMQNLHHFV